MRPCQRLRPCFCASHSPCPEQLQAGAVEHQMHGAVVWKSPGLASGAVPTMPGKRGVVGDGQLEAEQSQNTAAERLSLAEDQAEDEPQERRQLDRKVRVSWLSGRRAPARSLPAGRGGLVEPERQATAPPQARCLHAPTPGHFTQCHRAARLETGSPGSAPSRAPSAGQGIARPRGIAFARCSFPGEAAAPVRPF